MSEKTDMQKLEEKLLTLCQQDDSFVATINGEWGVGKTHFWDNFVEEHLKEKPIAYVSLFGKESIKEILTSIMIQISMHTKLAEEVSEVFGSTKLFGIEIASMFSIGKARDFKDVIICFDDFERSSENIDDKDILGLISELKEQKNCKVIMIYNQDQVESKIFSTYKDKVIDYELHFKPTVSESYNHISDKLKVYTQHPLEYFERKGVRNIRLMKRAINALNDFSFMKSHVDGFENIEQEIVSTILKVAVCNAKYHTFNIDMLVKYSEKKREQDGQSSFEIKDDYEDMLYLLDVNDSRYFLPNDIIENINIYIESSIPNEEQLLHIVEQRKQQSNRYEVKQSIHNVHSRFNYDLNYKNETFAKDMITLLKKHKKYIVVVISPESFMFYIDELCTIDSDSAKSYHDFGVQCLKQFLTVHSKTERISSLNSFGLLQKIMNFDSSLKEHIDEIEALSQATQTDTKDDIIKLMNKPRKQGSWGDEPELLMLVKKATYKQYIKEDADFFGEVIDFISWTQGFVGGSGFEDVTTKLVDVLNDIRRKGDDSVKFKISRALKHLNRDTLSEEEENSE